ncbi:hypothetical protein VM1G_11644 [Cytospora mali]|uniref:Uncharacterized protein n=1 Tax=Cytospora mali TaxID=578113 RepID=A0A194VYS3_CYTMA|nr:hypothetical protein VM1G_11644 [Valsa mali]
MRGKKNIQELVSSGWTVGICMACAIVVVILILSVACVPPTVKSDPLTDLVNTQRVIEPMRRMGRSLGIAFEVDIETNTVDDLTSLKSLLKGHDIIVYRVAHEHGGDSVRGSESPDDSGSDMVGEGGGVGVLASSENFDGWKKARQRLTSSVAVQADQAPEIALAICKERGYGHGTPLTEPSKEDLTSRNNPRFSAYEQQEIVDVVFQAGLGCTWPTGVIDKLLEPRRLPWVANDAQGSCWKDESETRE